MKASLLSGFWSAKYKSALTQTSAITLDCQLLLCINLERVIKPSHDNLKVINTLHANISVSMLCVRCSDVSFAVVF